MTNYWGIRIGQGGKYIPSAKRGKFIAIGWNEMGDLGWTITKTDNETKEKLKEIATKIYGDKSNSSIGKDVGQIFTFIKSIKLNDVVLVVDSANRKVLIGRVLSAHNYKPKWNDDCDYNNRRDVEWIKEVSRDDFSQKMKYSLGSLLSIFNLSDYESEIQTILTGKVINLSKERDKIEGEKIVKYVLDKLHDLDGGTFEKFVTDLLNIIGFEAANTQLVSDGGVDVIGELNAENLVKVTLRVQVKRVNGSIGRPIVQNLRGTLSTGEHGAIITTSFFAKQAIEEAEAENKIPITLVDGKLLVDIILKYYDQLDDNYKKLLNLKRREIKEWEKFVVNEKYNGEIKK